MKKILEWLVTRFGGVVVWEDDLYDLYTKGPVLTTHIEIKGVGAVETLDSLLKALERNGIR